MEGVNVPKQWRAVDYFVSTFQLGVQMKAGNLNFMAYVIATAIFLGKTAYGVEVGGVKMDDSVTLEKQNLQLNGAGVRYKAIFKVYAAALYLREKKSTAGDAIAEPGAKRVTLVMLRDVSSEELSNGFLSAMRQNLDAGEKANVMGSMYRLGALFSGTPELPKGTVLNIDLSADAALNVSLNGKKFGEPIKDPALCNALLKIWLGEKPVDAGLKQAMLGIQPVELARNY